MAINLTGQLLFADTPGAPLALIRAQSDSFLPARSESICRG